MEIPTPLHSWNVTPKEAAAIQRELRSKIVLKKLPGRIRYVAGSDISYEKNSSIVYASVVVLKLPHLELVDQGTAVSEVKFPYVPGLLSFRESPAVLEAWEKLTQLPDVLMVDGHGLAHPRRFGIACHLGLLLDIPTIGCAKSLLVGEHDVIGASAGSSSLLKQKSETIGAALRTVDRVKAVFVSVGHRVTLKDAIALVMKCSKGYRLPEPTRQAHLLVNALRRAPNVRLDSMNRDETSSHEAGRASGREDECTAL